MFLNDTTEAEYRAMAEEDDGQDLDGQDGQDDDYDPTHDSHGRTFW